MRIHASRLAAAAIAASAIALGLTGCSDSPGVAPAEPVDKSIHGASKSLQRKLAEFAGADESLTRVEASVSVGKIAGGGLVNKCIVTIDGPTQEDADKHCLDLTEQGCVCRSIGPTSCQCDCPD